MPRYEEKVLKWYYAAILLAVAFCVLYPLAQLGDRELYWQEGFYAAQAMEMDFAKPTARVHGLITQEAFPLFPWMAGLLHHTGLSIELSLRLISVGSMALLAILVGGAARRTAGVEAATVAAAVMISCNIVVEKSLEGYPDFLALLFLMAAWLTWFYFGAVRSNWNLAWLFGFCFCGLSFYSAGWRAIIYFCVPLIFMRRPLTVWPKLRRPGFWGGLAIMACFVLLWGIPYWTGGRALPFWSFAFDISWGNYLDHVFFFPFDVIARFMPWTILAWAPFCVALMPLDDNPIFSRFLRTIFFAMLFLLWFSPFTEPRDIIMLVPPVAILTGMNYWIVVRRYGNNLHRLLRVFSIAAIICGIIILGFYLLPDVWWNGLVSLNRGVAFRETTKYFTIGMINGVLCIVIGLWLFFRFPNKIRVWEHILLIMIAAVLCFWALLHPYKSQEDAKSKLGAEFRRVLNEDAAGEDVIVYKTGIVDLFGECYYMGGRVRRILSISELPENSPVVYLISLSFPESPERRWTNLLPASMTYKGKKIYLWKGVKNDSGSNGKKP